MGNVWLSSGSNAEASLLVHKISFKGKRATGFKIKIWVIYI